MSKSELDIVFAQTSRAECVGDGEISEPDQQGAELADFRI